MIHYTCDRCHGRINTAEAARYVVQVDITPVMPESFENESCCEADRDPLAEIHQQLSGLDLDAISDAGTPTAWHYDLCQVCYAKFIESPLGAGPRPVVFSPN